jgi:hypothetical protein
MIVFVFIEIILAINLCTTSKRAELLGGPRSVSQRLVKNICINYFLNNGKGLSVYRRTAVILLGLVSSIVAARRLVTGSRLSSISPLDVLCVNRRMWDSVLVEVVLKIIHEFNY